MQVQLANKRTSLRGIAEVLQQLRPQFSLSHIEKQIKKQMQNDYQIAYIEKEGQILCVAGFVVGEKLAWGKHVYVDDFVSNEEHRSYGAGRTMMKWLRAYAQEQGCQQMHLDSGVQRYMAHKFYLREGFIIASHHFSISPL
ncbi:GNAT family N-acetyltransferase [Thalassotalea sp. PLHSN55]|uniref:GNAT family N-acetyltransferase n=1 Tax=Thalassotalea sp. PLHSN55 TaxID=3435888 RepID=UPI003F864A10